MIQSTNSIYQRPFIYTGFCRKTRESLLKLYVEKSERFQQLLEEANKTKVQDISSSSQTSEDELFSILDAIKADRKCSQSDALKALALLSQIGATSPRAQENVKVILNNTEFKIGTIRTILKPLKRTLRRLAKTYATEFKNISQESNVSGNLFNKINLHYPNLQIKHEDRFWYSDFQSDNPDCPEHIRFQINTYYNDYVKNPKDKK